MTKGFWWTEIASRFLKGTATLDDLLQPKKPVRRRICIDDLAEQSHSLEVGQIVEIVAEHECEFYTEPHD